MKNQTLSWAFIGIVCLLFAQAFGTHLHVNDEGGHSELHGLHIHETDHHDHEHHADTDVSVLEKAGTWWSKLPFFVLAFLAISAAAVWVKSRTWSLLELFTKPRRRSRWRPPLRAPPVTR